VAEVNFSCRIRMGIFWRICLSSEFLVFFESVQEKLSRCNKGDENIKETLYNIKQTSSFCKRAKNTEDFSFNDLLLWCKLQLAEENQIRLIVELRKYHLAQT
jgi:hypothetical protein